MARFTIQAAQRVVVRDATGQDSRVKKMETELTRLEAELRNTERMWTCEGIMTEGKEGQKFGNSGGASSCGCRQGRYEAARCDGYSFTIAPLTAALRTAIVMVDQTKQQDDAIPSSRNACALRSRWRQ